jgi:mannose-6-phosphate isomerase-like protein (cupin superfamily)
MAQEILATFEAELSEVALVPATGGILEVTLDGETIASIRETKRMPDIADLKRARSRIGHPAMREQMDKVNLADKFRLFQDRWSPKIVGFVNDSYVKLVKVRGEFQWHRHHDEDEMFLVVKGRLSVRLRDREVQLQEGELFIVPMAVEHMPVAEDEAQLL